ncbi:MAG TPA: CRTAC1 family protein, partial [Gemmatimonadaceae bacterium]
AATPAYIGRLRDVLVAAPGNLAVRLELLDAFVRSAASDSAVRQLEELRRIPPELPKEAKPYADSALQLLRAGKLPDARTPLDRFQHQMEVTQPYQASLEAVKWADGPLAGRPVLTFTPKYLISLRGVREKSTAEVVQFVDATSDVGLESAPATARAAGASPVATAIAVGDYDNDGSDDIFLSAVQPNEQAPSAHLYRVRPGQLLDVTQRAGIALPGGATFATFADYDNDGWLDLFAVGADGRGHLFHNSGHGTFEDVSARAGIGDVGGARKAKFVDLDHDGDLDLLLVGGQKSVYRNNLDGTFTDVTAAYGLAMPADARDAAFGDFDGDGRIDVVTAGATDALFRNGGAQRFANVTPASKFSGAGSGAVAVGDYNNDGSLDLFVGGSAGGESVLWLNNGDGTFRRDASAAALLQKIRSADVRAATFFDYDNDGWLDLVVAGVPGGQGKTATGLFLFHNDGTGKFVDRTALLPAAARTAGATSIALADVDDDGDEDLFVGEPGGAVRLLRNDGGNNSLAVNIELKALRTGQGKNNDFGIGAKVELRAGDIYQTRVVTDRVTHFGLGPHLKADVLRVEWPNGVPQTVYFPGSDQDVVENELLKGSCAFVYVWDGKHFRFVTDAMWRSALGMPMGLMAGGRASAFAPAGASQEYVRIPGDALQPRDGKYVMQLTEELWETAYADELKLIAVDHPDSVDVFVDERFVPPGPVKLRMYNAVHQHPPLTAVDERGHDVLPALRDWDSVYVSDMTPTRYQGVVEPHDLVMDLGADAGGAGTYLFLRGWIYPTDASINVALSQQKSVQATPPSLEVRDASGAWKVVTPSLGFPSGKDKTMVIDLAGIFPTSDHHVRLRTTMQIYWDQAFVATDAAASPVKTTTLSPTSADLHFRGYSRTYRKGGRYGPYWFDYDSVTTAAPWRPITGAFTRFGDVLPLFRNADDMYVIMAPGDEATLQFDASSVKALPRGWKRDFLLYTDGWIKDSDLNTAFGTTVEPLPFHAIKSYPYAPGDAYPTDAAHERYRKEYNTRVISRAVARK